MDSRARSHDRERPYPSPGFPRTASRSSTSTSATRVTPRSANSSTSHLVASPRPSSGHPSHRFHHASCAQSAASRPASVLSRDVGSDSGRQSAASSYLQEKLVKRREEAERLAAIQSTPGTKSSMEFHQNQSSPARGGPVDGRPSSSGNGDSAKKKGMGLKEMETSVSTLHKQNFDLKLELFHRRERQSVLEQRIEALEAEKTQIDDVNDRLLDELEKRDKAVQEAVQMIVSLEARVETLLREREMVRQVDTAGYLPAIEPEPRVNGPTPKPRPADLARLEEDAKALHRMPSFMSDRTENTENLRKVYLSSRGSILSLHRITTEEMEDNDGRRMDSLVSPSLSVLSESSFTSVYGERDQDQTIVADSDEAPTMGGTSTRSPSPKLSVGSDNIQLHKPVATAPVRSDRSSRASSINRAPGPGRFQSIHDIIDQTSPLQKLAKLDPSYLDRSLTQENFSFANRGQSHQCIKDAKRDTLRRVMTDAPMSRSTDQTLPPTPDTISTSTLRRFKDSDDTLFRQRNVSAQTGHPSMSEGRTDDEAEHAGGAPVFQPPLVSAFGNGPIGTVFDTRPPLIPRPRSAGESTVSHNRVVDWDSESESVHSLDSSLDIWLQQGKEPKGLEQSRSESPDLFNFPPSGAGWAPVTFGPAGTSFGVPGLPQPVNNPVEDLMAAQQALFPDAVQPPPAPNRRSSLGAKTGPTSRHSPTMGTLRKNPSRSGSRRSSVDAQILQPAETVVAHASSSAESKPGSRSKDNHYPPSSGAASRGHRLNFFRRSIGGGSAAALPELVPAAEDAVSSAKNSPMGVPSWGQRGNMMDDDRASATPPPIMRNPRPSRAVSVDEGVPIRDRAPTTPTSPVAHHATLTPVAKGKASAETTPTSNNASGGAPLNRRKWLTGFGRASSLRNRAG